jgi:zinc and cadmium transporter
MSVWFYSVLAGLVVAGVSWVGSFTFLIKPHILQKYLHFLVSLSVGVLLGDAFIHLLPEAIEHTGDHEKVLKFTLFGIFIFFILEKLVRWHHHHSHHGHIHEVQDITHTQTKPLAKLNLAGDAIHNFIDGILIAGSFLVSPATGLMTTLVIVIHEIPQEIGDVGALIYGGYTPKKALWYNFLCGLSCVAGVIFLLIVGKKFEDDIVYFLPLSAGAFIYIAASDLIPELQNKQISIRQQLTQGLLIGSGIVTILIVKLFENIVH